MKTKWTKKVPKRSGWYWVKYNSKHGKAICPAILHSYSKAISTSFTCSTGYGDLFDQGGQVGSMSLNDSLRFGAKIEEPT